MPTINQLQKEFGIGLTGGIATGKTTVADLIRQSGYPVIDADELARKAVAKGSEGLDEVVAAFGPGYLDEDGNLDRKRMGNLVFSSPDERRKLEAILHPRIRSLLTERLKTESLWHSPRLWFYEAALIFETKQQDQFRSIWVTWCTPALQLQRLMQRSRLKAEQAHKMIASQMPAEQKARLADVVIDTSGTMSDVEQQIKESLNRHL